jgi:hypothetical protein
MTAFQLYLTVMFLFMIAYVISYEPLGKLQVELFKDVMNSRKFVDHYEYPSTQYSSIPTIVPVSIDGSDDNQHVTGWKKYWNSNYMKNDKSMNVDGSYMAFEKTTPLLYDGVRPMV